MRFELRLSPDAARDIEEILRFTAENFGERKCDQYRRLIREAFADLSKDPFGIRSKPRPEIHRAVRTYHIGGPGKKARHFILYRCDQPGVVVIGRILYDGMDISRHLPWGFDRE